MTAALERLAQLPNAYLRISSTSLGPYADLTPPAGWSEGISLLGDTGGVAYFFRERKGFRADLWRTDGTREGTVQVARMHDGTGPFQGPAMFGGAAAVVVGDRLFFSAAIPGTQFSSDGSESPARDLRVAPLLAPSR